MPDIAQKYKRDPILQGEELKKRPMLKSPKNKDISDGYDRYKQKIMLLPADRDNFQPKNYLSKPKDSLSFKENIISPPENSVPVGKKNNSQNDCKSILSYEYALPYRSDAFTKPITGFSIEERTFVYKDVNEKDFRRKALIGKRTE